MRLDPPPDRPGEHVRGRPDASVALVEYGDYECPYSRAGYRTVQRLERRLGGELRFAFRHFPLVDKHPHALAAAAAAEAAGAAGRFWAMHDLLFRRQRALGPDDLAGYAEELGLAPDLFAASRRGPEHLDRVRADAELGAASGVRGTPTFFVNGRRLEGGYAIEELEPVLRAAATWD